MNFFKKIFQEYHQSVKPFGTRLGPKTVCKGRKLTQVDKEINVKIA